MHVVHVYDGHERVADGQGSVPGVVWNTARRSAAAGHDVTVIERCWNGLSARDERAGVHFERLRLRTGSDEPWTEVPYEMVTQPIGIFRLVCDRANFARAALHQLRETNADVVHVHLPFAATVMTTVAPRLRDRLVYTAHIGETEKRIVTPRVSPDAYLAKRAARTVVLNPRTKAAFERRGVSSRRLAVVPNGVDVGRFDGTEHTLCDRVRAAYELGRGPVVLFVGTITPRKGILELMAAAARVVETGHDRVQFVLVGKDDIEPAYTERVNRTVADAGLDAQVTFTGFVPDTDLRALYELADVFVLPSFEEGSSIAVTEALAAGLPVIASRISGVEAQIEHGRHGLLCEPGDSVGLAEDIGRLLADPAERESMRAAVGKRRHELSWENIMKDIHTVYDEVAA